MNPPNSLRTAPTALQLPQPCAQLPAAAQSNPPPLTPPARPSRMPPTVGREAGWPPSPPAPHIRDQGPATSLPPREQDGGPRPKRTLRLLVLVVEHDVGGVVEAGRQVGDSLVPKLVDLEDAVVDVGDPVDVVLKDVDAEGMAQPWGGAEGPCAGRGGTAGRSLPWAAPPSDWGPI